MPTEANVFGERERSVVAHGACLPPGDGGKRPRAALPSPLLLLVGGSRRRQYEYAATDGASPLVVRAIAVVRVDVELDASQLAELAAIVRPVRLPVPATPRRWCGR